MRNSTFGARADMPNHNNIALMLAMKCKQLISEGCTFNIGNNRRYALHFEFQDDLTEDMSIRLRDNLFISNRATANQRPTVFQEGPVGIVGRVVTENNVMVQNGSPTNTWSVGHHANDNLAAWTNISGEMIFDSELAISATGLNFNGMPMPWPGYNTLTTPEANINPKTTYFPHVPPSSVNDARIRNVRYSPSAPSGTVNTIEYWEIESTAPKTITIGTADKAAGRFASTSHGFAVGDFVYFVRHFNLGVTTRFLATVNIGTDVITATGHNFLDGQLVGFHAAEHGMLPRGTGSTANNNGVAYSLPYFVRDAVAGVSFKVTRFLGGPAIDFDIAGLPNWYVRRWEFPTHYGGTNTTTDPSLHFKEFQRYIVTSIDTVNNPSQWFRVAPVIDGVPSVTPYNIIDEGVPANLRVVGVKWVPYGTPSEYTPLAGDVTPSARLTSMFRTAYASATTITQFDDGYNGQEVYVTATNGNTTIAHNANIVNTVASNLTLSANQVVRYLRVNGVWRQT